MDAKRRTVLTTGAAAAAMAAAPGAFGQSAGQGTSTGRFYQKGDVRIHYQEAGSGFPLLIIPGGGQNSTIAWAANNAPFNATEEFRNEYRCITADLRNATSGQSSGPLEIDRPWDSYTDDQLGLMDHLGIRRFMVLGFCIGGPFIWNLVKRAPDRIVAAVVSQPVGFRKEIPNLAYDGYMKGWAPELTKQRPDITMETVDRFLQSMYGGSRADFVHSVSRDVVRSCQTPVLVMPDDSPPHPYVIAMESAMLAPKSEVSLYPWKDTKEKIPLAVRQVRTFLRAYRPATA
jgi:pimeloyl-ACP methyl ester carboxylesterase